MYHQDNFEQSANQNRSDKQWSTVRAGKRNGLSFLEQSSGVRLRVFERQRVVKLEDRSPRSLRGQTSETYTSNKDGKLIFLGIVICEAVEGFVS
jgi:hypothetical protein